MKKLLFFLIILLANFLILETSFAEEPIRDNATTSQTTEYTVRGHLKDENGFAISDMYISTSSKSSNDSLYIGKEGYFTLTAKDDLTLYINFTFKKGTNGKYNELFKSDSFDIKFNQATITAKGIQYGLNDIIEITLNFSSVGKEYNQIKTLFKSKNYPVALKKGQLFLSSFDFSSNGLQGEKIEIENIVAESKKIIEYQSIIGLDKNKDYDMIISKGAEFIEKYPSFEPNKLSELKKYISEALEKKNDEKKLRRDEAYTYLIGLEKKYNKQENLEYYKTLIALGSNYLETYEPDDYKDIPNTHRTEIEKLIKDAEKSKIKIEEKNRKEAEAEERKRQKAEKTFMAKCQGKIINSVEYYTRINPYADKGKCVQLIAALIQGNL